MAAALAMFLRRSQCTRAATRPLSHSATQPIRCSATRPISHLDSAAMAGIIFYSADQKWQPWSPQNNQISCGYGGGFRTLDLKPPGAVRRCDGAVRVRASLHCGATNAMDFRGPGVCALRQVALPSNVCAPIAAGVAVRRCDGATVRRCDGATVRCAGAVRRCGARCARYHTVAAENPSILGLLAYVQCAELPCRAASAPWPAKVAKIATSQWAAAKEH